MKIADLHGRDYHFERFLAGGAHSRAQQFDIIQHFDERLIEAKVARGASHTPVLDEEEAVAGHAGHHLFIGVHFTDIPQAGNQKAAIRRSDHLLERRIPPAKDQIHRRFAVFIRESKPVPGRGLARLFGARARIHEILWNAVINQQDSPPGYAFPIEGRALLHWMISVVADADVAAKEWLAHPVVQARALIFQSGGRKIIEEESNKIEHGSGLK